MSVQKHNDKYYLHYGKGYSTRIQTGDFLLFEESGCKCTCKSFFLCFLDSCIKCCTDSKYTHVGMIVIDPDFTPQPMQGAYILQSTGLDKIRDVEDNQQKFGVQLDSLEQALKEAKRNNHVYLRTVQCVRNAEFKQRLTYAHSVVHNRPYDDNPIDWIKALFDDEKGKVHKKTTFFCSALVSFLLASLGIIANDTDWTIVRPKDLGSEPGHRFIQWLSPVAKEIKVF